MPDGTIPDPRQNPQEKKYGIIDVNGVYCVYDKESLTNIKRCLPFGFKIELKEEDIVSLPKNKQILWNGHVITFLCNITPAHITAASEAQEPVTKVIFDYLKGLLDNEKWPDVTTELK